MSDIKPCDATCHYSHYPLLFVEPKCIKKLCRLPPFPYAGMEPLYVVLQSALFNNQFLNLRAIYYQQ